MQGLHKGSVLNILTRAEHNRVPGRFLRNRSRSRLDRFQKYENCPQSRLDRVQDFWTQCRNRLGPDTTGYPVSFLSFLI